MPINTLCPSTNELQHYLLGQVPTSAASAIDAHLDQCPGCVRALAGVPVADTFTEIIQASGRLRRPRNPFIESLIEKFETLSRTRVNGDSGGQYSQQSVPNHAAAPETVASATAVSVAATGGPESVQLTGRAPDNPQDYLAPAQAPDEMGRLGGYRVLKVLGQGGMGVVFLAEDVKLKRRLALKVMRPSVAANAEARQRFVHEAQATAAIEHEHIVAIFQVGEERNIPYLAMPLLQGETLEDRLRSATKLTIPEAVRIAREIAEGLAAAHQQGLIHRDIKPLNIWLARPLTLPGTPIGHAEAPRVKILDFGLARSLEGDVHLTQTGAIIGTPAYMAPEQARGEKLDGRSDLFSLGCVLYRMLTGERPFKGQTPMSQLRSLEMDDPSPPHLLNPTVHAPLSQLTVRLLKKNASERPGSATAVVKWLRAIESDLPNKALPEPYPVAMPVTPHQPTDSTLIAFFRRYGHLPKQPNRAGLIAAATLLVVLTGSFGLWLVAHKTPALPPPPPFKQDTLGSVFTKVVDTRPPFRPTGGKPLPSGSQIPLVPNPEAIEGIDSWDIVTEHWSQPPFGIDFTPDFKCMILTWTSINRKFFDLADYTLRQEIPHAGAYHSLSPDGLFWAQDVGLRVDIGPVEGKAKVQKIAGFVEPVTALAWSPDSKVLAAASPRNLKMIDVANARFRDRAGWELPFNIPTLSWCAKLNLLACCDGGNSVGGLLLLDPANGHAVKKFPVGAGCEQIIWSPSGQHFAWCGSGRVSIWDVEQADKPIYTVEAAGTLPAWDRTGRFLAYGLGKAVVLFDVENQDADSITFTAHDLPLRCVAFAPNNKTLITAGQDKTMRFWSATSWTDSKPELLGTLIYMDTGRILAVNTRGHFTGSPEVEKDFTYQFRRKGETSEDRQVYEAFHLLFPSWTNNRGFGLLEGSSAK